MSYVFFFLMIRRPPRSTLLSLHDALPILANSACRASESAASRKRSSWAERGAMKSVERVECPMFSSADRKSTRLNSSHANISYAVFCLKKKKNTHLHRYLHNRSLRRPDQS